MNVRMIRDSPFMREFHWQESCMLAEPYQSLLDRLAADIPQSRLITDPLRTLAYGTDASFYRLIPKVIVKVENESETLAVLKACRELKITGHLSRFGYQPFRPGAE